MIPHAESGALLLKLYELRTEETLRRARAWFAFEFHPKSVEDVMGAWLGPGHETAAYRMAISYWDMAASLVVNGAIDAEMFNSANTEHIAFYVKLKPFLADLRAQTRYPDYLKNLETVVTGMSDAETRMDVFTRYMQRQAHLATQGRQRANWTVGEHAT